MLHKLIAYNWKYYWKLAAIIHGVALLTSVAARLIFLGGYDLTVYDPTVRPTDVDILILLLTFSFFTLLFVFIGYYVVFFPAYRFYRQLYSQKSYMTWMIPIPAKTHLNSHILSGALLTLCSEICFAVCIFILVGSKNIRWIVDETLRNLDAKGITILSHICILLILICIVSIFANTIQMFFFICVGQLFRSHKIMWAIGCYVLYMIIIQMFFTFFYTKTDFLLDSGYVLAVNIRLILIISLSALTLASVIQYFICRYIMQKRLNL